MKTIKRVFTVFLVVAISSMGLTSCNSHKNTEKKIKESKTTQSVKKPDTLKMSMDTLSMRIRQNTWKEFQKQQTHIIKEALETLNQTNEAITDLQSGDVKKAETVLKTAIKNTGILLKKYPTADLVPVDIKMDVQDLITTLPQINRTVKLAKQQMSKGSYQEASQLLNTVKSELDFNTINLPLGTYPDGLNLSLDFINKNKPKQAKQVLFDLLNSLVVNQTVLPLPVLRAQVMLAESQNLHNKKEDKSKVINLLENADYQLKLAQAIGYGNFDQEYTEISKDINNVKTSVKNGKVAPGIFSRLIKRTENFKNRLFNNSTKKK